MKKLLICTLLSIPLLAAGCAHPPPPAYYPPPPPPPPAYSQIAQQGFHDGFAAAQHDMREGKPPNFGRHPRFRNPPVPPPAWDEYRQSFRHGYEQAMHAPPPPPPQ